MSESLLSEVDSLVDSVFNDRDDAHERDCLKRLRALLRAVENDDDALHEIHVRESICRIELGIPACVPGKAVQQLWKSAVWRQVEGYWIAACVAFFTFFAMALTKPSSRVFEGRQIRIDLAVLGGIVILIGAAISLAAGVRAKAVDPRLRRR